MEFQRQSLRPMKCSVQTVTLSLDSFFKATFFFQQLFDLNLRTRISTRSLGFEIEIRLKFEIRKFETEFAVSTFKHGRNLNSIYDRGPRSLINLFESSTRSVGFELTLIYFHSASSVWSVNNCDPMMLPIHRSVAYDTVSVKNEKTNKHQLSSNLRALKSHRCCADKVSLDRAHMTSCQGCRRARRPYSPFALKQPGTLTLFL